MAIPDARQLWRSWLLTTTLEEAGYMVLTACDGEEAVRLFAENRDSIQILLTDVIMPGKKYDEISSTSPHLKVLFMSV